jgi:glycosyltransferase involved in cell wall biosynthesis
MPRVSVIVPNYNHAQFLRQRLESIFSQTYQDFELILLDDASTDQSQAILNQYAADRRVQTHFNTINSGSPFKQWNKGLSLAQGEYIWIAESDDYADPLLLEKLVEQLDQDPSIGVAYCQSWKVDRNGNLLSSLAEWTENLDSTRWQSDFRNFGIQECEHYLCRKNTIPNASAVVFRHSLVETLDPEIEQFRLCGDWLFWIKLLLKSDVAFVAHPLNYFRSHGNTCRSKLQRDWLDLEERINLLYFLSRHVRISNEALQESSNQLLKNYTDYLFYNARSLSKNFRLYQKLVRINTNLHFLIHLHWQVSRILFLKLRFSLGLRTRFKHICKND